MRFAKLSGVLLLGIALGAFLSQPSAPASAKAAKAKFFSTTSPLTPAQLATLKTDLAANADTKDLPKNSDGADAAAKLYAIPAAADFWVWRTSVNKSEFTNSTSVDATTFTWVGNGFITRSAGEIAAWQEIFDKAGNVNPSLSNVRTAFSDIFSGTGNAAANRTHLLAVARRKSLRGEKLFATGTGSTAVPGTLVVEGTLTGNDIQSAWDLP